MERKREEERGIKRNYIENFIIYEQKIIFTSVKNLYYKPLHKQVVTTDSLRKQTQEED